MATVTMAKGITCDQIRRLRMALGMSQQEFADTLGVTKRTVGNWERLAPPQSWMKTKVLRDLYQRHVGRLD